MNVLGQFPTKFHNWMKYIHEVYVFGVAVALFISVMGYGDSVKEEILISLFGIYFCVLLTYVIASSFSLGRKAKYAEAAISMSKCISELRNTAYYLDCCLSSESKHSNINFDETSIVDKLNLALTSFNEAFCITSSTNCRACIKLLGNKDSRRLIEDTQPQDVFRGAYVRSFARDLVSKDQKVAHDGNEGTTHLVTKNTDFNSICDGEMEYFFHGELWKDKSYRNSSDSKQKTNGGSERRKDYNSVIVYPIRYKLTSTQAQGESYDQILFGFLTIDSLARNAFEERYDVPMITIVANSLFTVLKKYRDLKQQLEAGNDKNTT